MELLHDPWVKRLRWSLVVFVVVVMDLERFRRGTKCKGCKDMMNDMVYARGLDGIGHRIKTMWNEDQRVDKTADGKERKWKACG